MKHVTASEARRNWFKLLDAAAGGEVIVIQRNDKRLILRSEKRKKSAPSYEGLIGGKNLEKADRWGWEWSESEGLTPLTRR